MIDGENNEKFKEYREKYKEFYYNKYILTEDEEAIIIEFEFEIPGLAEFHPKTKILKKNFKFKSIYTNEAKNMAFNIGLIELISYWKCACPPNIVVKCGYLNEEQKKWWKKLYFNGLGELFYRNKISTNIEEFVDIKCEKTENDIEYERITEPSDGYIIPIGGGKDSVVTLETLKANNKRDYCIIINPRETTLECARIGGFDSDHIVEIKRILDRKIVDLNNEGMINGHTPFSAMLAFTTYFVAYLLSKKYIALSNEDSANESNVLGEKVNHQYSKSLEFENDFEFYSEKYLKAPVKYFSFLRPLNEFQIAKLFSKHKKYHSTFKSCNVGSKQKEWIWCCNCAKCLFAYIILSPYLYKTELVNIFGEDLFEKKELLDIFLELTGNKDVKPFDCVGTFEEVNFAISKTIIDLEEKNEKLPYLLKYYKENFKLVDITNDISKRYNEENNLNEEQNNMLKKELFS